MFPGFSGSGPPSPKPHSLQARHFSPLVQISPCLASGRAAGFCAAPRVTVWFPRLPRIVSAGVSLGARLF